MIVMVVMKWLPPGSLSLFFFILALLLLCISLDVQRLRFVSSFIIIRIQKCVMVRFPPQCLVLIVMPPGQKLVNWHPSTYILPVMHICLYICQMQLHIAWELHELFPRLDCLTHSSKHLCIAWEQLVAFWNFIYLCFFYAERGLANGNKKIH